MTLEFLTSEVADRPRASHSPNSSERAYRSRWMNCLPPTTASAPGHAGIGMRTNLQGFESSQGLLIARRKLLDFANKHFCHYRKPGSPNFAVKGTTFTADQQTTLPIWIFSRLTRSRDRPVTNVVATFVILLTFLPIFLAQRISAESADTEGENK